MKINFCPNIHFMYGEYDFLDRFAAAKADGFSTVEMTFPYDFPVDAIRRAADEAEVGIIEFNLPAGRLERGVQRGLAAVPGAEVVYREQVAQGIAFARALGCPKLLTMAGIVQPDANPKHAEETLTKNLRMAADLCADAGITLLIETHNSHEHPNYLLTRFSQIRTLIEMVNHSNVRALFDFYHVQVEEGAVSRRFFSALDLIDHIQIGNPPDRREPGVGELDYNHVFAMIRDSGYRGWIGGEFIPSSGTTTTALSWMREQGWLPVL